MTENYTKGDWKIYTIGSTPDYGISSYQRDDVVPIATIEHQINRAGNMANAYLIKAAPRMYQALVAIASGRYYGRIEAAMTLEALAEAEGRKGT